MIKIASIILISLLGFFYSLGNAGTTDDFGIVMDIKGEVQIKRGEDVVPFEIGSNLVTGDMIEIKSDSSLVVVSYSDCNEWQLNGPDVFIIGHAGLSSASTSSAAVPQRQLPVCYSMDEFEREESDVIGGFVLRGISKDPLSALKEEFNLGKASNSTLITLIMHDLKNGKTEEARPYFEALSERLPDAKIVKVMSKKFKAREKQPDE